MIVLLENKFLNKDGRSHSLSMFLKYLPFLPGTWEKCSENVDARNIIVSQSSSPYIESIVDVIVPVLSILLFFSS